MGSDQDQEEDSAPLRMSSEPSAGSLIRPLGNLENMAVRIHKHCSSLSIVYSLQTRSQTVIHDHHMEESLLILFRKLQHLRCCVDELQRVVFREMAEEKIDFRRVVSRDWMGVHEELLQNSYDMRQGPLWCCRMIHNADGKLDGDIHPNRVQHQAYVILFAFLHCISDSTSDLNTFRHFFRILNNVLEGRPFPEHKISILPSMDDLVPHCERHFHLSDIFELVKEAWHFLSNRKSPFYQEYPRPKNGKPGTRTIYTIFGESETDQIIRRCKKEGCTVHGAFCVVAAYVMISMTYEFNKEKSANLRIGHAVNLRKFVRKSSVDAFGPCFVLLNHNMRVYFDCMDNFWEYARQYTKYLHDELDGGKAFQAKRIIEFCYQNPSYIINHQLDPKNQSCLYDFGTSNMGNVDNLLGVAGNLLEVVAICRSTAFHNMGSGFTHNLQTYRGRMHYTLDYFTNVVEANIAQRYNSQIVKTLHYVTSDKYKDGGGA